ncbi:hypothetical protein [uncultured Ferrimonas sp.]|nr:hypothetical protein [uncultured Ferrimonas sp.]
MNYSGPERRGKDRRWQIQRSVAQRWQQAGIDRRIKGPGRREEDVLPPAH